jgi:hypothetical protein
MAGQTLTAEQKRQWATDGYVLLEGVLGKDEVRGISRVVDRLYRQHAPPDKKTRIKKTLDRRNVLGDDDLFIEFMDHPATFDLVLDVLGPNIQLSMAEMVVRQPDPRFKGFIHTDGGQAMKRIRVTETSWPLQIKIQYFLTNVNGPDRGNFTLFPGSHLRPFPEEPVTVDTPGAVQVNAKAGDAAIFAHSLWHGAAPNRSQRARKTLIYCYSQMCFRPFDFQQPAPEVIEKCTPRQRRLLGDLGKDWRPGAYFYAPEDQEEMMQYDGSPSKKPSQSATG